MVSLSDWCLSFLHRMASHSTYRSSWDLTANYVSQSWMSHGVVLGRVLPPHVITGATTQSMSVPCKCSWAVGWLPTSQLDTRGFPTKACGFVVNIWSQMSGSQLLAVGSWSRGCTSSTGAHESHKVLNYCGPHIGCQVLLQVFLSYSLGEAQALDQWGYKTLRLCWCC